MAVPQKDNFDSLESFRSAQEEISSYTICSPLLYSKFLSLKTGKKVFLKLETQQPTSSFKVRPAFLGILRNLEQAEKRGVLTTSSGNFAQAVSYASHVLDVTSCIVMTDDTSEYKVQMTRKWGAEVVFCGLSFESRFEKLKELEEKRKSVVLHGFDSIETILADGVIALEIANELKSDFAIVSPASGGGLIAGMASALRTLDCDTEIYGVQPVGAAAIVQSLSESKRVNIGKAKTIADALVASIPGERTFSLIQKTVDDFVSVSEQEIIETLRYLTEIHQMILEPASAVSVAALLSDKIQTKKDTVVCVLSGANISYDLHYKLIQG